MSAALKLRARRIDVHRRSATAPLAKHRTSGLKVRLVYSCYLIRHGDDYLIWDTGFAKGAGATAPKLSLVELLAQINVVPSQVKFVGISHSHGDHIGQSSLFPQSTLLIGKGDWDVLSDAKLTANQAPIAP